jgi:hypothetical protein
MALLLPSLLPVPQRCTSPNFGPLYAPYLGQYERTPTPVLAPKPAHSGCTGQPTWSLQLDDSLVLEC